jgi:hypothetical protein
LTTFTNTCDQAAPIMCFTPLLLERTDLTRPKCGRTNPTLLGCGLRYPRLPLCTCQTSNPGLTTAPRQPVGLPGLEVEGREAYDGRIASSSGV